MMRTIRNNARYVLLTLVVTAWAVLHLTASVADAQTIGACQGGTFQNPPTPGKVCNPTAPCQPAHTCTAVNIGGQTTWYSFTNRINIGQCEPGAKINICAPCSGNLVCATGTSYRTLADCQNATNGTNNGTFTVGPNFCI